MRSEDAVEMEKNQILDKLRLDVSELLADGGR